MAFFLYRSPWEGGKRKRRDAWNMQRRDREKIFCYIYIWHFSLAGNFCWIYQRQKILPRETPMIKHGKGHFFFRRAPTGFFFSRVIAWREVYKWPLRFLPPSLVVTSSLLARQVEKTSKKLKITPLKDTIFPFCLCVPFSGPKDKDMTLLVFFLFFSDQPPSWR